MKTKDLTFILSNFENGVERFKTDSLFNKIIMSLLYGESEIKIIEQLLDIIHKQQKELEDLLSNSSITYFIKR